MCLMMRGCGSKVRVGDNLTLSQVRFSRVCAVLHMSDTAAHVCIQSETKARQLLQVQKDKCYDSDQTESVGKCCLRADLLQ